MNAMLPTFVSTLGWALIHFVWQGTLVGIATAIALIALRNARPQARYAVCCAALALCLALPTIGVLRGLHADASAGAGPIAAPLAMDGGGSAVLPERTPVAPATSWRSSLQGQLPWIVALWSIGSGLLALRMALGMLWVGRIGRSRSGASHPRWQRRLDRLAERLGIDGPVGLRVTADLVSPVAAGCLKPVVLVPAALLANMPLDLIEALLAHELAHIKRHDYLVNLLQGAIEALLFYHPVVWWLSKQIRIEREQIADDIAVQALGEPRRLALALHELDAFQQEQLQRLDDLADAIQLVPAANGGDLMSRIQRLIRPNQHALDWKMALPIIGMATFCLTVYARDSSPAVARPAEVSTSVSALPGTPTARPVVSSSAYRIAALARASTLAHDAAPAIARATAMAHATATMPVLADTRIAKATDGHGDAYALVRADHDGITMSGDTRDIPQIEGTRKKVHGDFLWVRHNGRTYIVQDPAVIAQAVDAWKTTEPIEKQMQALEDQMKGPEQRMEMLDKQMEALSNEKSPARIAMEKYQAQMEPLQSQIEAIGRKMEAVGEKMGDASAAQRDTLQRRMETLQQQMAPLSAQMNRLAALMDLQGKQIEASMAPVEKLGKQMEAESKPMEALGKQMEALGKQEEALSREADRKLQALLDEAMRNGKAVPTEHAIQRD